MLYLKYLKMIIRSQLQYPLSFGFLVFGQFLVSFSAFLSVYLLFMRFETIGGYSFSEVAICYAVIGIAFSLTECFARGFDAFSSLVKSGGFDRILLRPQNEILQILGSRFELTRLGRVVQSVIVMVMAIGLSDVVWTVPKALTLAFMIIGGIGIFTGVFILGATVSFFTVEGIEIINILTDGGREIASYPLNIYNKWVTRFFTFIIPFGCINYLPLMYITGRINENYTLLPLVGLLYILPCLLVWRYGVSKYRSTGS